MKKIGIIALICLISTMLPIDTYATTVDAGGKRMVESIGVIYSVIGVVVTIFGAFVIGFGFMGEFGVQQGWNERKHQGLIMCISGSLLYILKYIGELMDDLAAGVLHCDTFPFLDEYLPAFALTCVALGVAQIALNLISDKFGDKIIGIRILIGGLLVLTLGEVIDLVMP